MTKPGIPAPDLEAPPPGPPVNTYPIDTKKPMRVLRDVLELESAEARDLAEQAGLETP